MPTVEYMGKTFTIDEDGFIDSYDNWNEEWVQWVKNQEGIEELTEEHHKVIKVLRDIFIRANFNSIGMVGIITTRVFREPYNFTGGIYNVTHAWEIKPDINFTSKRN